MWCLFLILPAGCHGNLPVLNLHSASVAKNQHFRPCRKNYALDRKMLLRGFYNAQTFRSSIGMWRHTIRLFAAEIFQIAKKKSAAKYFV